MEPLKPEHKKDILRNVPQASPEDIEEYERLLAERFTVDPDLPKAPDKTISPNNKEERLKQLHEKLFPKA